MNARIFILLSLIWFANGFDFTRRCLLYLGKCVTHCPRKMHPYHTRCDKDTISQRTCTFQEPYKMGFTCGWSRCDCNSDLLMTDDGECVYKEQCRAETASRVGRKGSRRNHPTGSRRRSKKIEIQEEDDPDKEQYT